MIALSPQFASLLVAVTASIVGAVPNHHSRAQHRRYVLDVDIPGEAKVHMRQRALCSNSRSVTSRSNHGEDQGVDESADVKAVYIQPPSAAASSGSQSVHTPARRGIDGPIDQPDPSLEVHAENADAALLDHVADEFSSHNEGIQRKRTMFRVDSQYGPGLIITHAAPHGVQQIARSLAIRELDRRGLLDPLLPILGSIPGVGGIINLVAGTLSDILGGLPILGPILGGLLLSPHQPASAQSIDDGTNSGPQFFLDASSSRNVSTIYVVDSGHPTSLAIASQFNNTNTTSEHVVSLQMAFVNATSGQVQAYCATFDSTSGGQSALAAKPCITDGMTTAPHASQSFGWNPSNKAVRPMWDDQSSKGKRDYLVQAGSSSVVAAEGQGGDDTKSVVLVFEPFSVPASTSDTNSTEPSTSGKDTTGAAADDTPEAPGPSVAAVEDEHEDSGIPVYIAGLYSS